ncbi:MAG: HAMP domain-containing protein [Coriobacteriia bacterium]|nr:HAMP domain-containing protein [Coriobacteriia bacterium]
MTLTVKTRIAIAMSAILAINALTGALAWSLRSRAADESERTQAAVDRADWIGRVSEGLTTFVSEATDLAFGVSSGVSEESSAEYGDLVGADQHLLRLVASPPADLEPEVVDRITTQLDELRPGVFAWINAEATRAGSSVRLTLTDAGRVRASVTSNITLPVSFTGLEGVDLRRAVRREAEALKDGTLRRAMADARADADAASKASARAGDLAANVTLAAILVGFVTAVMAAVWLYRTIAGPLRDAQAVAEDVAAGDYSAIFTRHSDDEIGSLVHAVEEMRDVVVGQVNVMREMAGAVIVTADGLTASVATLREIGQDTGCGASEVLDEVETNTMLLCSLASQMLKV